MFYKKNFYNMKNKKIKNNKIQNGRRLFEKIVYIGAKKKIGKKIPTSLISVKNH